MFIPPRRLASHPASSSAPWRHPMVSPHGVSCTRPAPALCCAFGLWSWTISLAYCGRSRAPKGWLRSLTLASSVPGSGHSLLHPQCLARSTCSLGRVGTDWLYKQPLLLASKASGSARSYLHLCPEGRWGCLPSGGRGRNEKREKRRKIGRPSQDSLERIVKYFRELCQDQKA